MNEFLNIYGVNGQRLVWWSESWVTSTGDIHTEGKVRLGKGWAKAGPLWDNG